MRYCSFPSSRYPNKNKLEIERGGVPKRDIVDVTGAARLYRAASGEPKGYLISKLFQLISKHRRSGMDRRNLGSMDCGF